MHIKVGRAVNLSKRLDEWGKQCGSKEVVPRGWWPGNIVNNDRECSSLLKGKIEAGEKGKYCHRLESEHTILLVQQILMHTPRVDSPRVG